MKKITFILGLIASTVYHNADAQFTTLNGITTTFDKVRIGTSTVSNTNLEINSGTYLNTFNSGGCVYEGKSAIKVLNSYPRVNSSSTF
jgi:hypothetical protein